MTFILTMIALAIVFFVALKCAKHIPTEEYIFNEKEITLSPRFSLNPKDHILRDKILLLDEYTKYDDLIWDCLFSPEGDIYIRRRFMDKTYSWVHFDPEGEKLQVISERDIQILLNKRQIGCATRYRGGRNGKPFKVTIQI